MTDYIVLVHTLCQEPGSRCYRAARCVWIDVADKSWPDIVCQSGCQLEQESVDWCVWQTGSDELHDRSFFYLFFQAGSVIS